MLEKKIEPKVIPNLISDHTSKQNNELKPMKPSNFQKRDSASFHETKVLHEGTTMPDFSKTRSGSVSVPKIKYTEEKVLQRPVSSKDQPLKIESTKKEEIPFTKSVTNLNGLNPVDEVFQNASTSVEKIEIEEEMQEPIKKKKKNKWMIWIVIGIMIEIMIVGIILLIRELNSKDVLECTSSTYSEYFEATIVNKKRYYFKYGKITKLEDTTQYQFDNKTSYEEFKNIYADPVYAIIEGRIIVSNINDNDNIYEEKATYDYDKLRDKSSSSDEHNIIITTGTDGDEINLLDYNLTDIKIIYDDDYICK